MDKSTKIIGGLIIAAATVGAVSTMQPTDTGPGDQDAATSTEKRVYIEPKYNMDNVRFEEIRKEIDHRYQVAHDTLSKAYYEEMPFVWHEVDYGVLNKEQFDAFQAIIWAQYEILFHETNKGKPAKDQIPESEYNDREIPIEESEDGSVTRVKVKVDQEARKTIIEKRKYVPEITI